MHKLKILLFSAFIFSIGSLKAQIESVPLEDYVEYLKINDFQSPEEYIFSSYKEKDIIVLSERFHPEFTQYELIVNVLKDPRFVGDIYTEVGVFNMGEKINAFLFKEGLSKEAIHQEIIEIIQNLDLFSLWPNYNFYYLLESIYEINQDRNEQTKIHLYPTDIIFDWASIECNGQFQMFMGMMEPQNGMSPVISRNSKMAQHFIHIYDNVKQKNPNKKQALVIMNTYHGYPRIPTYLKHPGEPFVYSTAEYICKTYPKETKGILINAIGNGGNLAAGGKWDAAFKVAGNKAVGFDLLNTPFGKTKFDLYNFGGIRYAIASFEDISDGFIFYKAIEDQEYVVGIPGIFEDINFKEEFIRRWAIEDDISLEEAKNSAEIQEYIKKWNVKSVDNPSQTSQWVNTIDSLTNTLK